MHAYTQCVQYTSRYPDPVLSNPAFENVCCTLDIEERSKKEWSTKSLTWTIHTVYSYVEMLNYFFL